MLVYSTNVYFYKCKFLFEIGDSYKRNFKHLKHLDVLC